MCCKKVPTLSQTANNYVIAFQFNISVRYYSVMARLHLSISHELTQKEALSRIKKAIAGSKKKYAHVITILQENWKGETGTFSATAKGYEISGSVTVLPSIIELDADVPWAVTLMKGKIEKLVRAQAKELLRKS